MLSMALDGVWLGAIFSRRPAECGKGLLYLPEGRGKYLLHSLQPPALAMHDFCQTVSSERRRTLNRPRQTIEEAALKSATAVSVEQVQFSFALQPATTLPLGNS